MGLCYIMWSCLLFWLKGEEQKKLDVLSNEVFVKALVSSGRTVSHHIFLFVKKSSFRGPILC